MLLFGDGGKKEITVVSNGWHAGLVFKTSEIDSADWPQSNDFSRFSYIEVGWGDEAFYRSSDPGLWLYIRGAVWPTPSVLHVRGYGEIPSGYPERVTLRFSSRDYRSICRYVADNYAMRGGEAVLLGQGLTPQSYFYRSKYPYHLFRTCNVWTARALQAGGVKIEAVTAVTTKRLFDKINAINDSAEN